MKGWRAVENGFINAIQNPNTIIYVDRVAFLYDGNWMALYLPSGRPIFYAQPFLTEGKFGRPQINHWKWDQKYGWIHTSTWGGTLTENIVQAFCRDIMTTAELELEHSPYDINVLLTIYDEIVCEIPDDGLGEKSPLHQYQLDVQRKAPHWCHDMPIATEGYVHQHFQKG